MLNCTSELKITTKQRTDNYLDTNQYLLEKLKAHGAIKAEVEPDEGGTKAYTFTPFHAVEIAEPTRSCEEVADPVDDLCEEVVADPYLLQYWSENDQMRRGMTIIDHLDPLYPPIGAKAVDFKDTGGYLYATYDGEPVPVTGGVSSNPSVLTATDYIGQMGSVVVIDTLTIGEGVITLTINGDTTREIAFSVISRT